MQGSFREGAERVRDLWGSRTEGRVRGLEGGAAATRDEPCEELARAEAELLRPA